MHRTTLSLLFLTALITGCPSEPAQKVKIGPVVSREPVEPPRPAPPKPAPPRPTVSTGECDEKQIAIARQADQRATPWSIRQHLETNFPDMKISWLMKETTYRNYVFKTGATSFGRCNDTGCYLFAAPISVIDAAVAKSMTGETHDAAVLGEALGLPATNFEGPLRMFTIDLAATRSCVRLPVEVDPGVWKCKRDEDKDCFKFGGHTSGGVPELMVINAPVAQATLREIQ